MVLDATQHSNERIKGEWSNPTKGVSLLLHLDEVANEKGAFGSPSTTAAKFVLHLQLIL